MDPTSLLMALGLGKYAAAAVALAVCAGYGVTWIAPLLPPPSPASSALARVLYAAVNKIAANVGHAANATAPVAPPAALPRVLPLLLACGLALGLSACGAQPIPGATTTAATAAPTATLAAITQADLKQAIAEANGATPPDSEAATCFTWIDANLTTLQGQVAGVAAPVGVFSAFETANLALGNVGTALAPTNRTAAEIACAPLAQHVVDQAMSTAQTVASLLAALGIHVAIP